MRRFGSVLIISVSALGCAAAPSEHAPEPLRVAAASDLQTALPALIERFRREQPIEVVPTFGSSGQLAQQIEQGAPFDIFLTADRSFVEDLARKGIIRPDSIRSYAIGSLVLAVHEGTNVDELADLTGPGIRAIALANPAFAPYGRAGKQALERAGLWSKVEGKVVPAESVRQALQFVQSGNAEAGLVGRAIAQAPGVRIAEIDSTLYDPIVQGLGIVAATRRGEEAARFVGFLLGDEGQEILDGFGFSTPPSVPTKRGR